MKGYWHVPAIGMAASFLAIRFDSKWMLALFFLWLLYLGFQQRLRKSVLLISLAVSIFAYIWIPALDKSPENSISQDTSMFTGEITSPVTETESRIAFELTDKASDRQFMVTHFKDDPEKHHELAYGASCTVYGKPELPDTARNPGQFDYRTYLLGQGITHQITINSLESFECRGSSFLAGIYKLRSDLIQFVQNEVSPETAVWLNALVLGDDTHISDDTTERFQRWNLSHILAISGLHVGLLVGLCYFLLVKMNILTKEKAQWVLICLLPIYALVAGGEPSVMRASAMAILFMLASKLNWQFSTTDVLSIVFILLVLLDPYSLYHIGFQLSFCVTLGLLLSRNWLAQTHASFFSILKISFVSQMVILPLQVEYFFIFQPLSILLNLVVVPYFTIFVIPLMFLMLLLAPFAGFLIRYADRLFVTVHDVFMQVIQIIDEIFYVPLIVGSIPFAGAAVYYVLWFVFMKKLELKQLNGAFKYGCCVTALLLLMVIKPYLSPVGTVTMLDIGQGDAMVIELPYRKGVILVDAGARVAFKQDKPSDDVYKRIIRPYLYRRGISEIDAVFISHNDTDHMGSLNYVAENMKVDTVITSDYFALSEQLAVTLRDNGTDIIRGSPGETVTVGNQSFHVLAPLEDKQSKNDNSLVLSALIGGKSWLFTGDIGAETEKELVNAYPGLRADVLKVAHHGSSTSSDPMFLDKLQPAYGLISAGENNMYGHPHADVVKALEEAAISVIRTDERGAIQYHFSKSEGTFSTYLP